MRRSADPAVRSMCGMATEMMTRMPSLLVVLPIKAADERGWLKKMGRWTEDVFTNAMLIVPLCEYVLMGEWHSMLVQS